jgi:hypothetical protein
MRSSSIAFIPACRKLFWRTAIEVFVKNAVPLFNILYSANFSASITVAIIQRALLKKNCCKSKTDAAPKAGCSFSSCSVTKSCICLAFISSGMGIKYTS